MSDPPTRQSSVEAWVLMSLVYKDLDDFDYRNALMLAERLYAIDDNNEDYRFLYAKCLHLLNDYDGSYAVLKGSESIICRHLFARSCLDLGNRQVGSFSDRQAYWSEGVKALHGALELYNQQCSSDHHWSDDLKSTMRRSHLPSRGSICNLLGELYAKLENIRASSIYLWQALNDSPFKISAYTNLCDIAPDIANFDLAATTNNVDMSSSSSSSSLPFASPDDLFKDFTPDTVHLDTTSTPHHPTLPTSSTHDIDEHPSINLLDKPSLGLYMPSLRKGHSDNISLDQLRSLVHYSHKMRDTDLSGIQPSRSDIEERKDADIEMIDLDIKKMKTEEAYRNKHGLHKKPPKEKPQQLEVELPELDDLDFLDTAKPLKLPSPLRVGQQKEESITKPATKLTRLRKGKKRLREEEDEDQHLSFIFAIDGSTTPTKASNDDGLSTQTVIRAMNKVMSVLRTFARGYMYHSFYHCREAALSLQKLDDRQYDTPRILCILGKAYYDAGDYESARIFFCRSFYIAPWYCEGIPIYSTCLWYLEREKELNLLAYHMKDNQSHQYEAFVAAGNWSKCAKGGNEPSKWFQKAVDLDPSRSYGHALLGYEEWEKGNCLGAKLHFSNCMVANKRSYLGWYGMATAYQAWNNMLKPKHY